MPGAQRKALMDYRTRSRKAGLVRVEVQAPATDAPILRDLAAVLRGDADRARAVRDQLQSIINKSPATLALDIFGSDLTDAYFEGVFEQARRDDPTRDVDL